MAVRVFGRLLSWGGLGYPLASMARLKNGESDFDRMIRRRRESVFLALSGLFLGTLAMLNILGITRFLYWPIRIWNWEIPFSVAVGVLPYPATFLCTDLISELYGRRRANQVVWMGLALNVWVVFILGIGGMAPGFENIDPATGQIVRDAAGRLPVFFEIRALAFGAVTASMMAYMTAQFCDVFLFHKLKAFTKGKHLWLRNNGSTMTSQIVDTVSVILITHFYAHALPVDPKRAIWPQLLVFIASGYVFKFVAAALDTIPCYLAVHYLSRYLRIDPKSEHFD